MAMASTAEAGVAADAHTHRSSSFRKAPSSRSFYGALTWDLEQPEDESIQVEADHTLSRFVVHQDNPLRFAWTIIVTLLLAYIATVFLYRLAFCTFRVGPDGPDPIGEGSGWKTINKISDIFFWADLFLNFFLSYQDRRGIEVDSLPKIVRNYFRCFFWINLLACLPEDSFTPLVKLVIPEENGPEVNFNIARIYRLQRISRLAKLTRLTRVLRVLRMVYDTSSWFNSLRGIRVINFIVGLFWTIHLLACFWYLVAALHGNVDETWLARRTIGDGNLLDKGPFEQWITSMYFVLTVFTTVGFGDMFAVTKAEIIYVAFVMLIGAVVHSIIISEVIGIIVSTDQVQQTVRRTSQMVEAFAKHAEIEPELSSRLTREVGWRAEHFAERNTFDKGEMEEVILRCIPRGVLMELPANLFGGKLMLNKFIKSIPLVPPRLPCLLAVHLMSMEYVEKETVYQVNEIPLNIFIVVSGTFAFVGRPHLEGGFDAPTCVQVAPTVVKSTPTLTQSASSTTKFSSGFSALKHARTLLMGTLSSSRGNEEERPESQADTTASRPLYSLYPYQLFSCGSYFGDTDMMLGRLRGPTARCEKAGTALVLHKQALMEIQDNFPQFDVARRTAAARNEGFRLRSLVRLKKGLTFKNLAATRIQSFVRKRLQRKKDDLPARQISYLDKPNRPRGSKMEKARADCNDVGDVRTTVGTLRDEFNSFRNEMRDNMEEVRSMLRNLSKISV
mmetsp:Transcript_27613/g.64394  ORF Transcript_27613/g.64394 Transcript_27613/m.64394 type:complete len:730 (+) Transcript_27613:51-2240(+)|eukprot:CAMPEP_0171071618 /NCGR_PEP_ID=MMETSP0766_2-20121228/10418_1 /TAXON_ID=439317 /ORGANISM="Gambierdiscus australes, Strain CAWD 149" /LENGTH=729 /DNA_ID=CAMNT_0011528167 /DNA_START=41 /DNA_END=2230 /DNA_ORIENTATION=+